jgi:hypothetical protein
LKWIEGRKEFSEEETGLLLEGVSRDRLPTATVRKMEHLDLIEYLNSFPRNLGVFFKKVGVEETDLARTNRKTMNASD